MTNESLLDSETVAEALFRGVLDALEMPFQDDGQQLRFQSPENAEAAANFAAVLAALSTECGRLSLSLMATPAMLSNPNHDDEDNQIIAAGVVRTIHREAMTALDAQAVRVLDSIAPEKELTASIAGRYLSGQLEFDQLGATEEAPRIVLPH